jgi:hypothetical protein
LKLKLIALTLIAFACWLVPIKILAQETGRKTNAQTSPQTIPEVLDSNGAQNANPDTSERGKENEIGAKEKVTKHINVSKVQPIGKQDIHTNKASGRSYTKEEVQQLIKDYSLQYGINPEVSLCIAKAESGYNHLAKNKSSSASGTFQYLNSTWKGTDEGKDGLSVFDADANIKAAIKYMASHKSTQPWEVRNKCPKL